MSEEKDSAEFLAAISETAPVNIEELLRRKGVHVDAHSADKRPRSEYGAFTRAWHLTGKKRKQKRKTSKASRKKNRRRKK